MGSEMINRQTSLSGNTVMLCRYLRSKGYNLTTTEQEDVMKALSIITPTSRDLYEDVLKAILCKNKYQVTQFSTFYQDYVNEVKRAVDSKIKNKKTKEKTTSSEATFRSLKNWLYGENSDDEEVIASYSNIEVLTRKEFADMDEEEISLIMRVLEKLVKKIAHHKSRLKKKSRKRKIADLRLTIRHNLRQGNDLNKIIYSKKKDKKLNIVLLCDVSKSMDLYSKFFVQMIYAFQNAYDKIETFTFSTALHRITEILDNHSYSEAFDIIADRIPQWSGGTKIGSCLNQFYEQYKFNMLNRKTIVIILSDGWDTGEPDLLKDAMSGIHKSARKLIWLNPLSGNKNFSPEVVGLQNAMPYIDQFRAAHNLESLREVISELR